MTPRRPPAAVEAGTLGAGLPYLALGSGEPLVVLAGLTPDHEVPQGMARRFQVRDLERFAVGRRVWWINRRHRMPPGATMADLADDVATVLREEFDHPVDVVGISTGGSVALQLAADHPDVVRRLVLVASACGLGPAGRRTQMRVAAWAAAGSWRRAMAEMMSVMGSTRWSRGPLWFLGWLSGALRRNDHPGDIVTTIEAEDAVDLRPRLAEITAPVLVVGGERDGFYGPDLFRETADLVPRGRLVLYPRRGHLRTVADRRLAPGVLRFLATEQVSDRPGRREGQPLP